MSFGNCALPFNHLSKQDVEHLITQRVPSLSFLASSSWLGETTLLQPSITIDDFCPSLTSIQMFTRWVFFGVCLLLLNIMILRFTHIVALAGSSFSFTTDQRLSSWMDSNLSPHPLPDAHAGFFQFWLQ